MFPLRILRVPGLAGSSVVRGFLVTGMYSTFLLGVLYLQHVHGYGALRTGFAFLPLTLILGLFSLGVTPRLMARFGPTNVLLAGLASIAAALGTVAAERTKVLTGLGQHHLQALTGGFHLAWAIGASAVGVGALVALLWLRPPRRPAEMVTVRQREQVEFGELEAA